MAEDVKRMNINVEVSLHNAFKAAAATRGKNMTDELMTFIKEYAQKHGTMKKAKKGGR